MSKIHMREKLIEKSVTPSGAPTSLKLGPNNWYIYHHKFKFSWHSKQNHLCKYTLNCWKNYSIFPHLYSKSQRRRCSMHSYSMGGVIALRCKFFFATFVFQRWTIFSTILMSNGNHFFVRKKLPRVIRIRHLCIQDYVVIVKY